MASAIALLLDQGLPRDAARILRAMGVDCLHVGEIGMATATDFAILDFARSEKRCVVTLDSDFHTILTVTGSPGPSVVRIRIEGLGAGSVASLIRDTVSLYADELADGAMVTVKIRKTTCHRLR